MFKSVLDIFKTASHSKLVAVFTLEDEELVKTSFSSDEFLA